MKFKYKTNISIEKSLKVFKDNLIGRNSNIRQQYQLKNLLKSSKTNLIDWNSHARQPYQLWLKNLKKKSFQRKQLDWNSHARQSYQLWLKNLKKKSFQRKQIDWLKIKKNARQHDGYKYYPFFISKYQAYKRNQR